VVDDEQGPDDDDDSSPSNPQQPPLPLQATVLTGQKRVPMANQKDRGRASGDKWRVDSNDNDNMAQHDGITP
jgi:hypothetical protein